MLPEHWSGGCCCAGWPRGMATPTPLPARMVSSEAEVGVEPVSCPLPPCARPAPNLARPVVDPTCPASNGFLALTVCAHTSSTQEPLSAPLQALWLRWHAVCSPQGGSQCGCVCLLRLLVNGVLQAAPGAHACKSKQRRARTSCASTAGSDTTRRARAGARRLGERCSGGWLARRGRVACWPVLPAPDASAKPPAPLGASAALRFVPASCLLAPRPPGLTCARKPAWSPGVPARASNLSAKTGVAGLTNMCRSTAW